MNNINNATENAIIAALHWEMRREQFEKLMSDLVHTDRPGLNNLQSEWQVISLHLFQKEVDAWRSAFMFGLGGTIKTQEALKRAASLRFLNDNQEVCHYLTPMLQYPMRFSDLTGDEFRKEIRRVFHLDQELEDNEDCDCC